MCKEWSFNYVLQLNLVIRMHFIQLGPRNKRLHIFQLPGPAEEPGGYRVHCTCTMGQIKRTFLQS